MNKAASDDAKGGDAGGVAAVDRALMILSAFKVGDRALSLADLAARTGLNKSTILRLAQSLSDGRLLSRLESGDFRLGSEALRLGTLYQQSYSLADILMPEMRKLAASTGESVVFYVREESMRICLLRIESDQPIRHHVREGDAMPLEVGSPGRVILAFSGRSGEPYDTVRRDLYYISLGERTPDTSAIAAPVFGPRQELLGALAVSGPSFRVTGDFARSAVPDLLAAARAATHELGGDQAVFQAALQRIVAGA